jgi:hypothetical protein
MRAWCLVVVHTIGCAQLFGIDETSSGDAGNGTPSDARRDGTVDARPCAGGDGQITDPMTGACYTLFGAPKTRDEARASCSALGAALATVQSANENQLIATLVGPAVAFLGGNDELAEGTFKWDDGSDIVLTNWNTGEPNNGMAMFEEDCIVVNGTLAGKWDDRPCAPVGTLIQGAYAFVCERN